MSPTAYLFRPVSVLVRDPLVGVVSWDEGTGPVHLMPAYLEHYDALPTQLSISYVTATMRLAEAV